MQHNASNESKLLDIVFTRKIEEVDSISDVLYTNGRYDLLAVVFYTLICIIIHAVIQEYVLDVSLVLRIIS